MARTLILLRSSLLFNSSPQPTKNVKAMAVYFRGIVGWGLNHRYLQTTFS